VIFMAQMSVLQQKVTLKPTLWLPA